MIQLYINGQQVDIDKSVGLYISKTFESVNNPTRYHSDYSKTITLPMTANNRKVFEQYQRQDSVVTTQGIDPRVKIPYQLLYNSELVMEGYLKINNANTCFKDNKFEVNLYGKFNAIINDMSQYTFNKYECESYGGTKPDEYLIDSPWEDVEVSAGLVKQSFEQTTHDVYGEDILDFLKFTPTYQGKYKDFESNLEQWHPTGLEHELTQERDEHYMREFRSYYQQPSVWACKLWLMMKDKLESETDYTLELDPSWFNEHNPYWTDLLYTCPSLYTEDENFNPNSTFFEPDSLNVEWNIDKQASLNNAHKRTLLFDPIGSNDSMYRGGVFNPDSLGYTKFKMSSSVMICCHKIYDSTVTYAKLKRNNPLIVKVEAKKRNGGDVLASRKYMIYSHQTPSSGNYSVDEKINVGTTCLTAPNVQGQFPTGYNRHNGYWFEAPIDLELDITENVPYIVDFTFYFSNNGKPCEIAHYQNIAHWDWLWQDWFCSNSTPKGVTVFNCVKSASCSTTNYRRSRSVVDMYRVFPKKTTLLSVILNYSKMFGLLWDLDIDNRKITVMTRNRFFTGSHILDWSGKIDRSKEFKLEPLCFDKRYVNFNVEEGKGFRYEMYADKYLVGYGSKKIDTEYQFNSETDDLFKGIQPAIISQKSQFSRMYNTENPDDTENQFMGYNYKVYPNEHYLDNDNEGENAENSGAFVFFNGIMNPDPELGLRGTNGDGLLLITDDTEHMHHVGKYMWNLSFQNTEYCTKLPDISTIDRSGKYSVHFESPEEYYFDTDTSETDYVYNLFWKEWIDERYSVQTKKLTCYTYLTPADFKAIRFHDFVKIANTLYHINKVTDYDYDTNSPTKVELIQVCDLEAYSNGQSAWPALVATPDSLEVYQSDWAETAVYSTDPDWTVASKPSWITYSSENDILRMRATSDPLLPRNGVITLQTTTTPVLQTSVSVWQRPENTWLTIDSTTRTVEADGFCFCVNVSSRPSAVTVTAPDWIRVQLIQRQASSTEVVKVATMTACVTVYTNYRHTKRTGTITFSNGNIEKTLVVTQLGKAFIWEDIDDEAMLVEINHEGLFETYSNLEIDTDTTSISTLGTVTKPVNKIDRVVVNFNPQLDQVDHGDGTPEVCSGGQVTVKTLNGRWVTKNYNYGATTTQYEIWVEQKEGGDFTVDGRLYTELDFQETTDDDTSYAIVAIPDEGWVFVEWSDGVNTASRTVIVDSDIHIWPVFDYDEGIEYDNSELVSYDDSENAKYDNQ